jgi:hypothetical protein
MKTENKKQ